MGLWEFTKVLNKNEQMPADFIGSFIEYTKIYESPTSFWRWSAYTTVASILRDNCHTQLRDMVIYPNIYVLLLASSANHRKGLPVQFCEKYVKALKNTKIISGRSSIQAILDELARGETDKKTGRILKGGSALFTAREMSASIVSDPAAVEILTDIYDFKDEWTSHLRGSANFTIYNLCFNLFAASNEDLLKSVYDVRALRGGLLGRTFLITPNEFRPANSLFTEETDDQIIAAVEASKSLVMKLNEISLMNGKFVFEKEAIKEYDGWYFPLRESYKDKVDKSGVFGRIHTGALKIAMILCANYTPGEFNVKKRNVEEAIEEVMTLIPNYNQFIMGAGRAPLSEIASIFLTIVHAEPEHKITRKELLQKHWNTFDAENLDKLITTFEQAGLVQDKMGDGSMIYYLTDKCLELLFKGQEGKKP